MGAHIEYLDDPLNPRGWAAEPARRRVAVAFPDVEWRYRPAGMVETWDGYDGPEVEGGRAGMAATCARLAERYGMPIDEYLWFDDPPTGSWPACRAVAAAGLQGEGMAGRVLRACREATFIRRRSVSDGATLEAVLEGVAGLDAEAALAAVDDGSADAAFERHRAAAADAVGVDGVTVAGDRVELPTLVVRDGDAAEGASGLGVEERWLAAAGSVAGRPPDEEAPDVEALLERFSPCGWVSPVELAAATGRSEAAVASEARELVEAGRAVEETFAASPFFRADDDG